MDKQERFYQLALGRLKEQDQRNRDLDLKAGACLAVATTILTIAALVLNASLQDSAAAILCPELVFMVLGAAAYVGVVVNTASTMRPRTWELGPKLSDISQQLDSYEDDVLLQELNALLACNTDANETVLQEKATAFKHALWMLVLLPALLFALILVLNV